MEKRVRRKVNREDNETEMSFAWNAFVDLLAMEDHSELTEIQQPAHLVFWYMSEVENGGHLQYFVNRGTTDINATIRAMISMGMEEHAQILRDAGNFVGSDPIPEIASAEEYVNIAQEGDLDQFDARYNDSGPDPTLYLEGYLQRHLDEFIELTSEKTER